MEKPGAVVYKSKKEQDKIDEGLDKKLPKPKILKDGTRRWTFN